MKVVHSKEFGLSRVIEAGVDSKCELCGKVSELRPYGPNGENICFDCGMKDEPTTARMFAKTLQGVDNVLIVIPEGENK